MAQPVAGAGRPWAGLPERCLVGVVRHLPCILDHAIFAGVCRRWRSVAWQHPPRRLPWLMMPSTDATSFFCVASEETHHHPRLPDDARGARLCGSFPGGWLAAELPHSRGHALLNLLNDTRIPLPRLLLVHGPGGRSKCPVILHVVTLSAAPSDVRPYYAAAITSGQSNVAFWCPGVNYWVPPMWMTVPSDESWRRVLPKVPIEDVIYYSGEFYEGFHVLTENEGLMVFSPETNNDGEITTFSANYRFPGHRVAVPEPGQTVSRYLVESRGKLLMVLRFSRPDQRRTEFFRILVLQEEKIIDGSESWYTGGSVLASWNPSWPTSTFSGRRFFLGRGCSVAVDLQDSIPLYIYFLDDTRRFHGANAALHAEDPYPCHDTGKCWIFDNNTVRCFPRGPLSDCSPWIWFFLSDATFRSGRRQPAARGGGL